MKVVINKIEYEVNQDEFNVIEHKEYFNLSIRSNLGLFERLISLLKEVSEISSNTILFCNPTHGGFMPIQVSKNYKHIFLSNIKEDHNVNISINIADLNVNNIYFTGEILNDNRNPLIIFSEKYQDIDPNFIENYNPIILTDPNTKLIKKYKYTYEISDTNFIFYIPDKYNKSFTEQFKYCIQDDILYYDNLINLCIMVKNGGELFEEMLSKNMNVFDRWTILDTGSTDGTVDVIKKMLVGKKNGTLYEEPFINFRESRNRCLELAGTTCKYNLMLDDTYVIEGDLRSFLTEIRGDQFGDSYSLTIKSHDVEYISNRITKTENKLRYIYTMHEVIQDKDNINVRVPDNRAYINDMTNDYMQNRSDTRKEYDLKCLYEMLEEYPDDPRNLFYLGQTYKMLGNFEKAAEYYEKRAFFHIDGFDQEKFDALFEFTRINIYQLKKPWREYEKYYKLCIEWQPTRPEGNYFLGIHYFMDNDHATAFKHFKRAFEIGFPYHQQYSLKPTLSFHFLPYYLSSLCYEFKDFKLGLDSTTLFLQHNKPNDDYYNLIVDWYKIYENLVRMPPIKSSPKQFDKPIFCIVADGGFTKWTGKNILTTGVGGSETWVIETARYINQLSNFEVIIFCNCEEDEIFEGVKYLKLSRYLQTISEIKIEHCIISRFSEYIPATIEGHVENIHLILHDLQLSGNVIPLHNKIKNIFCLTEWHKQHFLEVFPQFEKITHPLHYGIDFTNFLSDETQQKEPYSFIYSSFPNRGLNIVLKMWPKIIKRYPQAVLHIFTDVNNKWANDFYPEELKEIRKRLEICKEIYPTSVINHGWVDKKTLANFWKQSSIWLYPCKFKETFCLTALEAALTKTLAITNDLAALQNTVGDRGIVIPGDADTEEWQKIAFEKICDALDNREKTQNLIERNYQWALKHSWKERANYLLQNFILNKEDIKKENIQLIFTETDDQPLKSIDKIYYINLSKRTDRNQHFIDQMKKQNIPEEKISRFEAVNGLEYNFSEQELDLFKNVNYLHMPTKLQIMGNQLSHFKIFQEMIERNYKYIIVCQDDIVLKHQFTSYIDEVMSNIPDDAEIVHFGFHKYAVRDVFLPWDLSKAGSYDDEISDTIVNKMVCKLMPDFNALYNSNNTTGYILTLNGAKNFIEYVSNNGFKYATDCDLNAYLIGKDIYYGSRIVLATTFPTFGSDVFENMWNPDTNDNISSNPYKLTVNNFFLNYLDMYNWTNDLPANTNAKITFVTMLANFIKKSTCEILEIGTFAGTSVIGMLQYLPNARATTIDPWNSYEEKECGTEIDTDCLKNMEQNNVENVFHENILKSGFREKVTAIKGSSEFVLIDLIKEGKKYDFIYVDGSHKAIDCYTDCLLSWQLLNENGIMAIDDYLYKISLTDEFENVMKGVDHFLEKIKGHYVLLENGYRLFIQKIRIKKTYKTYETLIDTAFKNAENNISKITSDIINMEGMSGTKTRHFYNNLLNTEDARYLEIGTWKGSSVCSAMCGNKAKVVCIDNWSEFGGPKDDFLLNFDKFKGNNKATFIESDCYKVDVSLLPKFNIYMYDGNHTNESHYKALLHYYDCLDDIFIFIVDDWNWKDVREGTRNSIERLNLQILYEKEIRLTWDESITPEPELSQTWWNGIYVAILQKNQYKIEKIEKIDNLKINYLENSCELCEIGQKYDTDKSSQRNNVTNFRHCHPYTLFYDGLFKNKKNKNLKIAELGILDGASLLMWREYFTNSEIYGFEYNNDLINNFKQNFDNDRITLSNIDVTNKDSILKAFSELNILYDIIIEDTTHQFEDQIRVIENIYQYLKPGGILIIEDIFKSYNENDYLKRLTPILEHFQDYYFIELDHNNKNSTGWDNDKLFILIKGGEEPIFKNTNKLTIITPSYRVNNLLEIKKSINFEYIEEWIIVYDGSKVINNPNLFENQENNKIKEYVHKGEGISGNSQRNYALTKVSNPETLLYYLDDDNIFHPNLYRLLNIIDNNKLYTFNQDNGIKGNNVNINCIDSAMIIIPYKLCINEKWILDKYNADGYYIKECYDKNKNIHIFVDNDLCYYNKLSI